jgi:hypothetical protein
MSAREEMKPVRVSGPYDWNVWGENGALHILETEAYKKYLKLHPKSCYIINFEGGTFAEIEENSPLWDELKHIANHYTVKVFPLCHISRAYKEWSGLPGDCRKFNAILIQH